LVFSSFQFCLIFLPCVIAGALITQKFGETPVKIWLIVASLVFYAAWYIPYLFVLLGSIIVNFGLLHLALAQQAESRERSFVIAAGIVANVCLLGFFKYSSFLALNVNTLFDAHLSIPDWILPLGISFFTFQKIALLVEIRRGEVKSVSLLSYMLFVTFFPQLIAGPIVLFPEVQGQYERAGRIRITRGHFVFGISLFVVGLFKKAILADLMASFAIPVFDAAANSMPLHTAEAWSGVIAYTLQIYFDFSGYSDMAVGLAAIFGIVLPFNFASPYRATSIIDFWRRWHITLSRFLRIFLYIPLGGNRKGPLRMDVNLMVVMLIGGLWHGAAWTFVAWGGLHGFYLIINHFWRFCAKYVPQPAQVAKRVLQIGSWLLTFFAVVLAWVFFRADSFAAAALLLRKMFDLSGATEMIRHGLPAAGLYGTVAFGQINIAKPFYIPFLLLLGLTICLAFPNTQTIFQSQIGRWLGIIDQSPKESTGVPVWKPSVPWGIAIGLALAVSFMAMSGGSSPFIYFNF
jgi:alginate O-acetyltransferase complex protein AlgI